MNRTIAMAVVLAACGGGTGTWEVETWGEEYIEQ
jgi:hypothetical protein